MNPQFLHGRQDLTTIDKQTDSFSIAEFILKSKRFQINWQSKEISKDCLNHLSLILNNVIIHDLNPFPDTD